MLKKSALIISFLVCSNIVFAQELQGKFADWSVFRTDFGDKKICYLVSLPIKQGGNYFRRGEPYFLLINSSDNVDEIMISSGFGYKQSSEVELSFGLKKFNIMTFGSRAWANDKKDDIEIVKEMRKNLDVVVFGVNKKNQYSSDVYSLIGFNKAFLKMKEVCRYE